MIVLFFSLLIIIITIVHFRIFYNKKAKVFNKIPGIPIFPLIGNAYEMVYEPTTLFYLARAYANRFRKFGNICRLWFVKDPVLFFYEPDDIEVLLSSTKYIKKGYVYDFLHYWLKEGLLTSTGEKWQKRRKILTPTFHFNILRRFCQIFNEQSDVLVENLKSQVGARETEVLPFITTFTLHAICETAMGFDLDSSKEVVRSYKQSIYDLGKLFIHRICRWWVHPHFVYYKTPTGRREIKMLSTLHAFTTGVIRERRSNESIFENVENIKEDDEDVGMKKRLAMLDLLLKAERDGEINEDGIREEVDTFMFEGHDTTTMAITFFLMLIANHPKIQDRIVQELNEILGSNKKYPTIEDLNKMNYLEMCIKESLRLYPSVPFISRKLQEDMHLKKYFVPAGTECCVHIFDIHRNPDLFPDPDKYDPDRFLPENTKNRHPYAYIPFSAGPRNCIGQRFALLEEKAVISAILRNYKLEPVTRPDDIIFACDIILRTVNSVKVKFLNRNVE